MTAREPAMWLTADEFPTLGELVDRSVAVLREHEPPGGYVGCFSGGKDSVALRGIAERAGVKVNWRYNLTTIDPPPLMRFMREHHRDVEWIRPKYGPLLIRAAEVKGFPTRKTRWCCEEYKEGSNPAGATLLMGIRAEESSARASRWGIVQNHWRTGAPTIQPLLDWSSEDVWEFIRSEHIPYCGLYDEGWTRLGCIGCPMARLGRLRDFARWPRYEQRWREVFRRTWERRTGTLLRDGRAWFGDVYFRDWEEMWFWWLYERPLPVKGQTRLAFERWVRFDLTTGEDKPATAEQVRDVCEDIGIPYENAVSAGGVRYGCFSYEVDEDDEPEVWANHATP